MDQKAMLELIATLVAQYAKLSVKNPESKAKLKKICLRIFNTFKTLYADDPDFA